MNGHTADDRCYSIGDLARCTGLTDRTIRTYLSMGILEGEKVGGVWRFTQVQADAFMRHPAVRPSILANHNAVVYDFLMGESEEIAKGCMVLDFPRADGERLTEYFCRAITEGDLHDLRFTLDTGKKSVRVILRGHTADLMALVNGYYRE